jgi:chromosome segregation ATPase
VADERDAVENPIETLRRSVQVQIEGVHDHIRLVAESAASQSEAIVRKLDGMETRLDRVENRLDRMDNRSESMENRFDRMEKKIDRLHADNLSQHKTLLNVLSDHESRISALERERER